MPTANDILGTVYKKGSALLMARIEGPDGTPVMATDIDQIRYSVFELDPCQPDLLQVVAGHDNIALVVDDVFYDTLQTGPPWTIDATGYNFRHELDITQNDAFPIAGSSYQVRFEATPTVGQRFVFRFLIRVI